MNRIIRMVYRRLFRPNGPRWWHMRMKSVGLIMALHGCSIEEAERRQRELDVAALRVWLQGY